MIEIIIILSALVIIEGVLIYMLFKAAKSNEDAYHYINEAYEDLCNNKDDPILSKEAFDLFKDHKYGYHRQMRKIAEDEELFNKLYSCEKDENGECLMNYLSNTQTTGKANESIPLNETK